MKVAISFHIKKHLQKKNKNIFTMYQNSTQLDKYIFYTNKERKHKYLTSYKKTSPAICVVLWQWMG
jgi:hypothetical protein